MPALLDRLRDAGRAFAGRQDAARIQPVQMQTPTSVDTMSNPVGAGALAPMPPNYLIPLGIDRIGWEVYNNLWSAVPGDVRMFIDAMDQLSPY